MGYAEVVSLLLLGSLGEGLLRLVDDDLLGGRFMGHVVLQHLHEGAPELCLVEEGGVVDLLVALPGLEGQQILPEVVGLVQVVYLLLNRGLELATAAAIPKITKFY